MTAQVRVLRRRIPWQVGCCLVALVWPWQIQASESPLETIRATTRQVVAVLQNPALQGRERREERMEQLWTVILPKFDSTEIAKRSLGAHWQEMPEAQKSEFVQLFVALVKRSYRDILDRHAQDAQFLFDRERVEGDFAEVYTRVLTPAQNKPLSLNYRLHRRGGKWLIYDVVAENVSMVRNYRTQFSRVLNESSYAGLVEAIRKKLGELDAAPTATGAALTSQRGEVSSYSLFKNLNRSIPWKESAVARVTFKEAPPCMEILLTDACVVRRIL